MSVPWRLQYVLMLGDYNFPDANWEEINSGMDPDSESVTSKQLKKLSELMRENFMCQTVIDPTRGKNFLDLVITNNPNLITHHEIAVNVNIRLG